MKIHRQPLITASAVFLAATTWAFPAIPFHDETTRYEITIRADDGSLAPLKESEYVFSRIEEDENGVVSIVSQGGKRVYHPFNVASQALPDNGVEGTAGLYFDEMVRNHLSMSSRQIAALEWLIHNKRTLANGAVIWRYPLPLHYTTFSIEPGWPSAFSQARIIHAFVYAARVTQDAKYIQLALSAAKAYTTPIDQGGLLGEVENLPFYEEVPVAGGHSPHILNGHLYSTVALFDLATESKDAEVTEMVRKGADTALKLARYFDSGVWTKYDLVPKINNILFLIRNSDNKPIRNGKIMSPEGQSMPLTLVSVSDIGLLYGANLPGDMFIKSFRGREYTLTIVSDKRPDGAWIGGHRPETNDYLQLEPAGQSATEYIYNVPLQFLSDSTPTRIYQRWHARLMKRLYEMTGEAKFIEISDRWMRYDQQIEKEKGKKANLLSVKPPH